MSADGGSLPAWARDGRELFFRSGAAVMSVAISPSPKFSAGQPRMLFQARSAGGYSVGRDGRFLMIENMLATTTARPVTVVLNWLEELKGVQR